MMNSEGWVQDQRISPETYVLLILTGAEPKTQAEAFPSLCPCASHDTTTLVNRPQEAGGDRLESLLPDQHVM